MKKKILIFNCVPVNNGDAALVLYAYEHLINKGYDVKLATHYFKEIKKIYPAYPWVRDINDYFLFRKLPFIRQFCFPILFVLNKAYRNADFLFGSPGGYINSYYGISGPMMEIKAASRFNKNSYLLPQSFGPLKELDKKIFKRIVSKNVDYLLSRDDYSTQLLKELALDTSRFEQTADLAFLGGKQNFSKNENSNKIGISVRSWKHDQRNLGEYKLMIQTLVKYLVSEGYEIVFLSTCQGLPNYVNDADVAIDICKDLALNVMQKIKIDKQYHTLQELEFELQKFKFIIGTRLHMCILAMNQGIPALNISYEVKGIECYKYLGLSDYSIDYNSNEVEGEQALKLFISKLDNIRSVLYEQIPKQKERVATSLNNILIRL